MRNPLFTTKEYVAAGGCMHRLRVHLPVGAPENPWEQDYVTMVLPCRGTLHSGGNHKSATVNGKPVLLHEEKGGRQWY